MPNSHGEKIQTPVKAGRTSAKATALLSSPKSSSTTTPKRTHHKKLILTFWISVTAEGDSCIHAAQIGGHVSAARCFLEDLTTLGAFWFKEPLMEVLGYEVGDSIICRLISDPTQWPQFIISRASGTTSQLESTFKWVHEQCHRFVLSSKEDNDHVSWKFVFEQKLLSHHECERIARWNSCELSQSNHSMILAWRNRQVQEQVRREDGTRVDTRVGRVQDRTGRNRTVPFVSVAQEWDYEHPCEWCGFVYLKSHKNIKSRSGDRELCCRKGKLKYGENEDIFSSLIPYTDEMIQMIIDDPKHFAHNSAVYNRILAIGGTFIDNGRGNKTEQIHGNSCVTINGEVRYYIPQFIQYVRGGLHYFTYDGIDRMTTHAQSINDNQSITSRSLHGQKVKLPFLHELYRVLKTKHSLCEELGWIGEEAAKYDMLVSPQEASLIVDKAPFNPVTAQQQVTQLIATIKQKTDFLEVAAFSADNIQENRTYYVKLKGKSRFLQMRDPEVDGLMYPLFYTHNEKGYNHDQRKQLHFNQYIVARVLQPEPNWRFPFNPDTSRMESCTNRFQLLCRLMQYYVVEWYARAVDYRLRFMRKLNKKILAGQDTKFFDETIDVGGIPSADNNDEERRGDDHEDYDERRTASRRLDMIVDDHDEEELRHNNSTQSSNNQYANNSNASDEGDPERVDSSPSSKSFLADSITGSPRHLKACALNALAVVSQLGAPTFFITLTCNPNWPELKERLPDGQTAFDRPDVTVLVFKARLKAFLHNLRHGKYFGGGKKVYIMSVIEYQHRGLPHAHIVFKIENSGETTEEKIYFVDKHIAAYFPVETTSENEHYCQLIRQHMVHTCSTACKRGDGICKRGYMDRRPTAITTFDEKGYPVYKRPSEEDLKVVPHNRQILEEWNGHANVEFCGRTYAVLYLYKYLYKGNQKVSLQLNNTDDVNKDDEIKLYQRGRMICAMQALWCLIGYQTYPGSDPSVVFIKSKVPALLKLLHDEGKVCDLSIYFNRPYNDTFRSMTYTDFFAEWDYCTADRTPNYAKNGGDGALYSITIKDIAGLTKDVYKRKNPQICRMGKVPFTAGEAFYLRLLLSEVPAYSFGQLKRYWKDGQQFDGASFQEAAIARGLVQKVEIARIMFNEELSTATPYEFRHFFVHATLHGFPTLEFFHEESVWHRMCDDFYAKSKNRDVARNDLLKELARLFKAQSDGKSMESFGLPQWQSSETELDMEKVKYPKESQKILAQKLLHVCPLTNEMQQLFDAVQTALKDDKATFVALLQGRAGSGKSTFAKYVAAYCRSLGKICLGCASTGLAATVYDDFSTAHSLFAIPVIEDAEEYDQEGDIKCKLDLPSYDERRKLLEAAKLIIWDEISSQHMKDIGAVYRALDSFKGKVVIFIGDALQITPVVKYGNKEEICAASIYCGGRSMIHNLQVFKFTKNLRLQRGDADPEQVAYIKLLDQVSTNVYNDHHTVPSHVRIDVFQDDANETDPEYINSGRKFITFAPNQLKYLQSEEEVVHFAFPHGFNPDAMHKSCILATKNEQVEEWNAKVQQLNPEDPHELLSWDTLDLVDDPFGYIQRMITDQVMNDTNDPGSCPPHKLTLKVGDICILMRAVCKEEKFATNTRVRIAGVKRNTVRVQSLFETDKFFTLPRFVFKIKLSIGKGYEMTRHQFPLRLAYSMSINKSQGQQYERCPVDLRSHSFSHGHLNVALSRITDPANIALFVSPTDYEDNRIITSNVVYKEILNALSV